MTRREEEEEAIHTGEDVGLAPLATIGDVPALLERER
jgi:hypothetical protein